MIVYISPGILHNYTETKPLMKLIRSQNERLRHRVVINTVTVSDARWSMYYDTSVLRNVALQHFDNYGVPASGSGTPLVSSLCVVMSFYCLHVLPTTFSS